MRTLMLIASVAMIVSGIFCMANGSAAFLTVAFLIGLMLCIMGVLEIVIGTRADFDVTENAASITKDGIIMLIFGIVVISGQITEDTTAQMLFALWLTIEGVLAFNRNRVDLMHLTGDERIAIVINFIMLGLGVYMFFNLSLFGFDATSLIGGAMVVLGMRRFRQSFEIEYSRPTFITGNEEKLREAQEEEKRALAKAKEGIREQKNAQRRIRKIREDMAAEQDVLNSAALRREERQLDKGEAN